MSGITRDEWLAALSDVASADVDDDPSVITAGEAAELLNVCQRTAWRRLSRLVKSGAATSVYVRRLRTDGRVQSYPAYRLTKPLVPTKAKKR